MTGDRFAWASSLSGIKPKAKLLALYLAGHNPGPGDDVTFDVIKVSEWTNIPTRRLRGVLRRIPGIAWRFLPNGKIVIRWKEKQQEAGLGTDTVRSGGRTDG